MENFTMTRDEADTFLRSVLFMTSSTPADLSKMNRERFVDELVRVMLQRIPFQTITAIATPRKDRHLPSPTEIKRDISGRIGGLCYPLNTFCWMLLRALGFTVSLMRSEFLQRGDVHVALLVHHLTYTGSAHMVDVGNGYPMFRTIPLDFGEISPEYHDSFLRYRFIREGDDVIYRQCLRTAQSDAGITAVENGSEDGEWRSMFRFKSGETVDIEFFAGAVRKLYTEQNYNLSRLRCFAFPDDRLVCIKDATLLLEREDGLVHKSHFRSRDEIIKAFSRFFPQFSEDVVRTAVYDEHVELDFEAHDVNAIIKES